MHDAHGEDGLCGEKRICRANKPARRRGHADRCFIIAGALAATAANIAAGISFPPRQIAYVVLIVIGALGLSAFYTVVRPDERVARLFRAAIELFLLSFVCGSLSYAATSLNRPLWDEVFVVWDQAIGFDWRQWLGVLNGYPKVNLVLALAYHSMWPQLAIVIVALVTVRDYRRLDVLLLAFGIAAVVTVVVAGFVPALSPLAHFAITPADHPNIVLAVPREFEAQALALRDGSMRIIELGQAQGLVTFPSFHTVVAVLLLLGFRHVPYLRWVSLVAERAHADRDPDRGQPLPGRPYCRRGGSAARLGHGPRDRPFGRTGDPETPRRARLPRAPRAPNRPSWGTNRAVSGFCRTASCWRYSARTSSDGVECRRSPS